MGNEGHKNLNFIQSQLKSPPMSEAAQDEAGFFLRQLQAGRRLSMPISRPMPSIGKNVHELRIVDRNVTWRVVYRIGEKTIDVVEVFAKKTQATPKGVIDQCQRRLKEYDGGK